MRDRVSLWGGLLLVAFCFCWATSPRADATGGNQRVTGAVAPGYKSNNEVSTYREGLDGGEAFAAVGSATATDGDSSVGTVTSHWCGGYASVTVSALFSTASATCVLSLRRYDHNPGDTYVITEASAQTINLTAEATYTSAGKYRSTYSVPVSTCGRPLVKVLAADPSAGTIDICLENH